MLTLREKIMLALLEKKECSRKELAGFWRVAPSQVSRIIKKMIKNRDIEKNRRYVIGSGRFNDFYSLTSEGIFNAKELKEKIGKMKVMVRDKGKLREKRISEINMNFLDVVGNVSNNVFDPEKIRKKFVVSENIPKLRYFFGREEEINEIQDFLKSESKVLVIKGVAGIGKTTLGAKIASEQNGNVYWYRFNEWDTLRDAVRNLGFFLKKIGKNTLSSYVNSNKRTEIGEVSVILEKDLSNVLMFFDDCHHAKGEDVLFFRSLLDILEKKNNVKVVMLGRSIPLFYDRRDAVLKKNVKEMEIYGLDEKSGKKLLKHRKIDDKFIDDMLRNLKGHPLFLELASENAKFEIDRYLSEEVFAKLGENEKNALGLASVFRYPFHFDVFSENEIDHSIVESLVEKSLLKPDFFVHDLIRNFVYPRLTKEQKTRYHGIAGSYYESNEEWVESIYHFLIANPDRAAEIAAEKGEMLIRNGHVDDFLGLLNKLDAHKNELLLLKGDIFDIKGEWDKALECYNQALKVAEGEKSEKLIAKCYLKIGNIQEKRSEWDVALENFNRGLDISKKVGTLNSLADGYHGIGYIYRRTGELDKALEIYNKAIEYYKKTDDAWGTGKTYIDIGNIHQDKGEYDKAIEFYNRGLSLSERVSNNYEIVRAYNNLGGCYGRNGMTDKAIEYCKKQIKLAEEIGDIRGLAYGLSNLSSKYEEKGDIDKAMICIRKALPIVKKLGDKYVIADTYINLGCIFRDKKEWKKSIENFKESIKVGKEIKSLDRLSDAYLDFAKTYKSKGDSINAKKQFENALKCYEKLGNKRKIKEIKKELSRCQKKRKALKNSGKN
ncbi:MAG: tetratricopeptide repeat protein [Thermoplasmatales archaeon]|nr:tetratricopeptide repeat protein [Thermoplasmatales archaeon]